MFEIIPATAPLTIAGIELGTAAAGIRQIGRADVALISIGRGATVAAVFTRNRFCAAPVTIAREHLRAMAPRFLLVNSGNANAGTGRAGEDAARRTCRALAEVAGCDAREVLPFSTGVIGEHLPVEKIAGALAAAVSSLSEAGWEQAARAIMTTDTMPKSCSVTVAEDDSRYAFTGIAKGAGMIRPDMATMLSFVATDAAIARDALNTAISEVTERTFNRITIDGDTSTNDACVFIAAGAAERAPLVDRNHAHWPAIVAGFEHVCRELATAIVRDGEGATKFVTVEVVGGCSDKDCLAVAYAVAESPLVKTALFAADPNWGRILAAVGRAGVERLAPDQVSVHINGYCVAAGGQRSSNYSETRAAEVMARPEIAIRVVIGTGDARARVWTCDLSYDYVRINAEYRS